MSKRKIYRFSRGETFQCVISIDESGLCVFDDIKYPVKTTEEVIELLVSEAEREVLKMENSSKYWGEDA